MYRSSSVNARAQFNSGNFFGDGLASCAVVWLAKQSDAWAPRSPPTDSYSTTPPFALVLSGLRRLLGLPGLDLRRNVPIQAVLAAGRLSCLKLVLHSITFFPGSTSQFRQLSEPEYLLINESPKLPRSGGMSLLLLFRAHVTDTCDESILCDMLTGVTSWWV